VRLLDTVRGNLLVKYRYTSDAANIIEILDISFHIVIVVSDLIYWRKNNVADVR